MTYYFCIAEGMGDFSPTTQNFHVAEMESEFREIVEAACEAWENDLPDTNKTSDVEFYAYEFRMPSQEENNYSQRLRIAAGHDFVLDLIGMTESEYQREMGD